MNFKKRAIGVALAVGGLTIAAATGAVATSKNGESTASCNATSAFATNGTVYQHSAKGTLSVKQTDTDPELSSAIKVTSQNGNSTSVLNKSDGQTATWTGVLAGQYKVYARASASVNCNGFAPGDGNYNFEYTITY